MAATIQPVYIYWNEERDPVSRKVTGQTGHIQCPVCQASINDIPQEIGSVVMCLSCLTRYTVGQQKARWPDRIEWVAVLGDSSPSAKREPVTVDGIMVALQQRHPQSKWVFLPQVRTRTGYSRTNDDIDSERYLDAFAMSLWPSEGFRRVGYEVKVSRSDWLREVENPRKRAQGYFLTSEFWFAFAPGVYERGDEASMSIRGKRYNNPLDGCGILEVQEDGTIKIIRHAVKREAWPMPDTFVASLLRSFVSVHHVADMQRVHADAVTEDARDIAQLSLTDMLEEGA